MRIYPGRPATTSSIKKRLGRPLTADQLAETFIDEEEEGGEESSDGEMQWEKQLKRPRYSTLLRYRYILCGGGGGGGHFCHF
jgi:hypothetical protein